VFIYPRIFVLNVIQDAIYTLNNALQSNAAAIAAVRASGPIGDSALTETVEYLGRIGYRVGCSTLCRYAA
jgi:hypothetical protein